MTLKRATAFAGLLLMAGSVFAQQDYPNRPMRMVIPWPPGQATDLV
jgi:tripartite-type tricarboxylate transporter receptor subunit TctC